MHTLNTILYIVIHNVWQIFKWIDTQRSRKSLLILWDDPYIGLKRWHSGISAFQCRRFKRHRLDPWVRKFPWSRKWKPAPVFLIGKFHGQRSMVGYYQRDRRVRCDWTHTHDPNIGISKQVIIITIINDVKWKIIW